MEKKHTCGRCLFKHRFVVFFHINPRVLYFYYEIIIISVLLLNILMGI